MFFNKKSGATVPRGSIVLAVRTMKDPFKQNQMEAKEPGGRAIADGCYAREAHRL
jgi:hypothetical protein